MHKKKIQDMRNRIESAESVELSADIVKEMLDHIEGLGEVRISKSYLVKFLYTLMEDHVPIKVVENIVHLIEAVYKNDNGFEFRNVHLCQYAKELAERLAVQTNA